MLYNIPKHIAKYAKPLPYFMKYASEYYGGLNTFSNAQSNMNRLCKDIEKWCKKHRYSSGSREKFDYNIMIDDSIPYDEDMQLEINKIYLNFCKDMQQLQKDQVYIRKYGDPALSKYDAMNFTINWGYYYAQYRERCEAVCSDPKHLANMAVRACYEFHPQKMNTKFIWRVASKGVVDNIKQVPVALPQRADTGEFTYLGKKYNLVMTYEGDGL